jgi:hypothetical protein
VFGVFLVRHLLQLRRHAIKETGVCGEYGPSARLAVKEKGHRE